MRNDSGSKPRHRRIKISVTPRKSVSGLDNSDEDLGGGSNYFDLRKNNSRKISSSSDHIDVEYLSNDNGYGLKNVGVLSITF
ncbi:hypothetical protein RN001_000395 [Aquatica leii]|uniref:Uncharacterized protein n=1 Tax=Aquatica leii TaxID=1421715 RepID=A0AAN7PEV5_9COLE|nr:hypothetical protein RN001_000395 [Aquatica leii]